MKVTVVGLLFGGGLVLTAACPALASAAPQTADPACAVLIQPGDSLSLIADGVTDPAVTAASLQAENEISEADVIHAGQYLDVCVGNGINDVTGEPRDATPEVTATSGVEAQQQKLNQLFVDFGIPELDIDGVSGPLTRQQLCAARVALNLPISTADMVAGSEEEQLLMAATSLPSPTVADVSAERWIVIDKTCQVMFAGELGNGVTFVFPTSTGEAGYETTNQDSVRAFRYDPALENDGWHNSSRFPVAGDNPLNGNMYRPVYFHRGQAIHGANNVPPEPKSKGCARLHVEDQDALIGWLGLGDATEPIWNRDRINLTVAVQGEFVAPPD